MRITQPSYMGSARYRVAAICAVLAVASALSAPTGLPAEAQTGSVPVTDLYDVQTYSTGGHYTGIQLVDMDGDDLPEIVAGNRSTSRVEIWTDDPSPGFSLQMVDQIQMPYHVHDLKVADVDEDGSPDLVVGGRGWGIRVALDRGPLGTSFWPRNWAVSSVDSTYNWQVIVADFDGDTHLDIFDGIDRNYAKAFYGAGNGTFMQGPAPTVSQGGRRALGHNATDLDGDGRLDILGFDGTMSTSYVRAFLNTSSPGSPSWSADLGMSFMPEPGYEALNFGQPTAGDFDGNGHIDIVGLQSRWPISASNPAEIMLFEGDEVGGNLIWTRRTIDTIDGGQFVAALTDIDDDDLIDIVVTGYAKALTVYYGDGVGGYDKTVLTTDHWHSQMNSLPTGDVNGDGFTDIVAARESPSGGQPGGFEVLLRIPPNQPPVVGAGGPYNGNEGSAIALNGATATDPDSDPLALSWTVDPPAVCSFSDDTILNPDLTCDDNGTFTVTLTADDGTAAPVSDDATVTVTNVAPTITALTGPVAPVDIDDQPISVSAEFSDPGAADTHTCTVDPGDGTGPGVGTVVGNTCTGPDLTYTEAGIYDVCLTVTDPGELSDTACTIAVVYDPEGGFVTGGGWIDSPEGAYVADPEVSGRATFGFVSKYKKGANTPTGNTKFRFQAADLSFHSDSYDWLVVTGGDYAKFKGSGTINGEGGYKFKIWAGDDDPDTFRIKIWTETESGNETVIYDNGMDQAIGGGSIVIHTKK